MVIWGLVVGIALAIAWPSDDMGTALVLGLFFGPLAGLLLRFFVRREIKAALAKHAVAAKPAAVAAARVAEPAVAEPARPQPPEPQEVAAAPGTAVPLQPVAASVAVPVAAASIEAAPSAMPETEAVQAAPVAAPPLLPPTPLKPDPVTLLFEKARDWLFGGNTVVRVGILILFVGLAFLAKYAIDNALLPPELRLAAIAAAGIGLFVAGFRLRNKDNKLAYALTLQGGGVGVLYLTVFAAFRLYQFMPAGAAFVALGLICAFSAVIAVAQNALAMAFIGFAGGFAAPLLVSTGEGNYVALFSYYLMLGVVIAALAWHKAWRSLNLLGFIATFAVATVWGVLKYKPENFSTTEPFLVAFFLVYLAAALMYALRHALAPKRAIDATLIFGVPVIAFSLQLALVRGFEYAAAFSSLAMGALYLVLGWWMMRPRESRTEVHRWLAECFAALGLGFVTLAVPLALDPGWTSAVWAIEGAAVFWMGRRQERWLARLAGLALQVLAALIFLADHVGGSHGRWPIANASFIGGMMLAAAAFAIAWWTRNASGADAQGRSRAFAEFERGLSPFLFWLGFVWVHYALLSEIERAPLDAQGTAVPVFGHAARVHLQMLAWISSAFVLHYLALPQRKAPWPIAATPAYTVMPVMLLSALAGVFTLDHVFMAGGWISWPLAMVMHVITLKHLDSQPPRGLWTWTHAAGVWLLVLLGGNLLIFAIGQARLWQTAWATVILLVAGIVVLLVLSQRGWFERARAGTGWPLGTYGRSYLWTAAVPLAVMVALGCLVVAMYSDGNAKPLPYVPLLNPTDLAVALGLAACGMWLMRVRQGELDVPAAARDPRWVLPLVGIAFIAINTVWLRIVHHYYGIAWDGSALFESFLVQAGYSILWTLIALGLMVGSHRRAWRRAWMLGAGLLGLTVLKLFVIDLSNRGGSERIFVFIAVGVLMLVVGYFAPLPPSKRPDEEKLQGAQT